MILKDYIKKKTDPIKESYYKRLAEVESANNPLAQAGTSSAAGLYQFTKGTWTGLTKELGLDYSLDDRFDPVKSREVVEEFTKRNKNYLMKKLGREPNEAELYLAHFQGMGGANKLLSSLKNNPNANVDSVVGQKAIIANKNIFLNKDGSQKKVKDIYNWAANKFGIEGYKEKGEVKTEPITQRETREIAIDNTRVSQPIIKEPNLKTPSIQAAKFNELFRFDTTEPKLPEYIPVQQESQVEYQQESQPVQLDPSLYDYIELEELQKGGEVKIDNTRTRYNTIPKNINTNNKLQLEDDFMNEVIKEINEEENLEQEYIEDKYHVRKWNSDYINSPKYKERLQSSGYKDINAEIEKRDNNVSNTEIEEVPENIGFLGNIKRQLKGKPSVAIGSVYKEGTVYLHNRQADVHNADINEVSAHEFKHAELDLAKSDDGKSVKNNSLNEHDFNELRNRLKPTVKDKHSLKPGENAADLNALRYSLQYKGYDAGKEDFTEEHLDSLEDHNFTKKRLLKNYSKKDLIWLMNNIAGNITEDSKNTKLT